MTPSAKRLTASPGRASRPISARATRNKRDSFGLIDAASIRRKHGLDGRLLWVEIKLSDWVFNAIRGQEVLTLHPDYFRLGKPLERRVYELARKHCGRQPSWSISLEILLKKSGSQSSIKRFRQHVKHIAEHDHLPDYHLAFDEERDVVLFTNRDGKWVERPLPSDGETLPPLPAQAYEDARAAAPGYDIHGLESEWREWWASSGKPKLDNPAAAFVGFCRSRHKRAPIQREADRDWWRPLPGHEMRNRIKCPWMRSTEFPLGSAARKAQPLPRESSVPWRRF